MRKIQIALTFLAVFGAAAVGCTAEPAAQEEPSTDGVTESDEALTCGSYSGTVGGYSTKCSCSDFTLPCSATQTVAVGNSCVSAKTACWVYYQRSGTWSSSTTFSATSVWAVHTSNCNYNPYC